MLRWILIAALSLSAASALAYDESKIELQDRTDGDRVRQVVMPDFAVVARTPEWKPEKGWPALRVDTAVQAAVARLKAANPKYDSLETTEISIESVRDSRLPNRWYLFLDFEPIIDGRKLHGPGFWAVVLLDGTVLLPEVVPNRDP